MAAESVSLSLTSNNFAQGDTTQAITKHASRTTLLHTFKDDINTAFSNIETKLLARLLDTGDVVTDLAYTHYVSSDSDLDLADGNSQERTMAANETFTFTGATSSQLSTLVLRVVNASTYTATWPGAVDWITDAGSAPTFTNNHIVMFYTTNGGTTWYGYNLGGI